MLRRSSLLTKCTHNIFWLALLVSTSTIFTWHSILPSHYYFLNSGRSCSASASVSAFQISTKPTLVASSGIRSFSGYSSLGSFPLSSHSSGRLAPRRRRMTTAQAYNSDDVDVGFEAPEHVVIAGAGVIGTTTAYYLFKNHGITSTVVDPTGTIAPAASGKAGGFLAMDWNDMTPTEQLTRRSFQLHQELADTLGPDTVQYRRLTCAAISVNPNNPVRRPSGKKLQNVEWADGGVVGMHSMGTESTIAQVHPKMLCNRLWEEISGDDDRDAGSCALRRGRVTGAVHEPDTGSLTGAKLDDGTVLPADAVLFACGPWTANIMRGVKYHSAVVPTANDEVLSQCVFFSGCGDPEVYVRPDATAYCTGFPEPERKVTERPGEEQVDPDRIAAILRAVREASGSTRGQDAGGTGALCRDPVAEQACYLPTTTDGIPAIGKLPPESVGGGQCYIASGHSCWGILLGPATGESMASLIATGKSTPHVDLRRFDPSRFRDISIDG